MDLPCLNPNCHSRGRPHPNCKCYGYADGGEVNFCSGGKLHQPDCEYYLAEGGDVPSFDDMPSQAPTQQSAQPGNDAPPDFDSMPDESHTQPNFDDLPDQSDKFHSMGQQALGYAEDVGRGLAGPLFTGAEKMLGADPNNILARQNVNPIAHAGVEAGTFGLSMAYGVGEAGLAAKGISALTKTAELSTLGRLALKGAVEMAVFEGSDETTKALLGVPGSDPEHPVAAAILHVGAAALMGAVTGPIFALGEGLIGKGAESVGGKKIADAVEKYLVKIGEGKNPAKEILSTAAAAAGTLKTILSGSHIPPGITYQAIKKGVEVGLDKVPNSVMKRADTYAVDAIIKSIISNSESELPNAVHYASKVAQGIHQSTALVESLFKAGATKIVPDTSDKIKEEFMEFIKNGQTTEQLKNSMHETSGGLAKGGMVSTPGPANSLEKVFPEQNMLLSAAKGRISNYLNSLRPTAHAPKLPYDSEPEDKEKKRSYLRAIGLAVQPLSIMEHVRSGELTPEHMQHFTAMFPDGHKLLSKELTKKITETQLNRERPSYKRRLAMSLFLGANLDSTMTPMAIQAIQSTYAPKQAPQQMGGGKPSKGKTNSLSKASDSYLTDDQARVRREQKI